MKNGKLVSDYLDECAAINALKDDTAAWIQRMVEGEANRLWHACVADGWTPQELDAAFERRFGRKEGRQ